MNTDNGNGIIFDESFTLIAKLICSSNGKGEIVLSDNSKIKEDEVHLLIKALNMLDKINLQKQILKDTVKDFDYKPLKDLIKQMEDILND